MDIFSCASQYCQIKIIMLKASKNIRNFLKAKLKKISFQSSLESVQCLYVPNC